MFPGSDIFARVPFHVAHTVLEKGTPGSTVDFRIQVDHAWVVNLALPLQLFLHTIC
jgi:hypothetical protein